MAQRNGIHIEGGALCAACRQPRPYAELLAFGRLADLRSGRGPVRYVCRPSVSDMRFPLCTSRVLASAAVHAVILAAELHAASRQAPGPRRAMPEHVARYAAASSPA